MPPRLPQAASCEERRGFRRDMTLPTRPITAFVRKVSSPDTHVPVAPVLHLATGIPCRGATAAGGRGSQRVTGSDFRQEKIAGRGMKATAQEACQFSSLLRLSSFYFGRPLGTRAHRTVERAQWAARRPHTVRCCFIRQSRWARPPSPPTLHLHTSRACPYPGASRATPWIASMDISCATENTHEVGRP